jgi:hypothetical protein
MSKHNTLEEIKKVAEDFIENSVLFNQAMGYCDGEDGFEKDVKDLNKLISQAEKRGEKRILAEWKKSMDKYWFTHDMQSDYQKSSKQK